MHRTGKLFLIFALLMLTVLLAAGCSRYPYPSAAAVTPEPVATAAPAPTPSPAPVYPSGVGKVVISELMSRNKATLMDADGDFPDWIELENLTDEDISLTGWTLSDGKYGTVWSFPDFTLYRSSRALIFADKKAGAAGELHASFSVSAGEEIFLRDANGTVVCSCAIDDDKSDYSLVRKGEGYALSEYPTPGFENTPAGYEMFMETRTAEGPLAIYEVCVENSSSWYIDGFGYTDWVEIKNISSEPVDLGEYYLSDDSADLMAWSGSGLLGPGEIIAVLCESEWYNCDTRRPLAPFSLNSDNDRLYLTGSDGRIIDYAYLHGIPYGASYGRLDGRNGFFYFPAHTPGEANFGGARRVSGTPVASQNDGVFSDVQSVTVELSGEGTIYYTLDCTYPSAESTPYTEPIVLTETTVLRAISIEEGTIPGRALTLSYIFDVQRDIPVVSVVADDLAKFNFMYWNGYKNGEKAGHVSFYDTDGRSFSADCGIKMNGESSLVLPKKNLALHFKGAFGCEKLEYDLFGGGVTSFKNLVLRAGQDQYNTIVRNELCYSICRDFTDSVLTERFRYCAMYLNGKYNGLYAIMEKPNEQHYAATMGVSPESVTMLEASVYPATELYQDVFEFCYTNDMSDDENLRHIEQYFDTDSFIDWCVIQGYFGNADLADGNLRYAKSDENDGRWRTVFYDLDNAYVAVDFTAYNVLSFGNQVTDVNLQLLQNASYRDRLLTRAAEACRTVLADDYVIGRLEELCEIVRPEVDRDSALTRMDEGEWRAHVDYLESLIRDTGWQRGYIENLCHLCHLTDEERLYYFGDLL